MRFSLWPDPTRPFEQTLTLVRACEKFGWHAAYFADHFMPNGPDSTPLPGDTNEAMTTLGALASQTTSIRLGTLVAAATYRHPAVLTKSFVTLDNISGGRAIVGLGAGWQLNEHASYGIDLGTVGERVSRFEEYVEVVAMMLSTSSTNFSGEYYQLSDAPCDPRPVQSPPPILLGVRGIQRTMALAAKFAAIWNAWCTPEQISELGAVLDGHCEKFGRDPRSIEHSTQSMLHLSNDESWLKKFRDGPAGRPMVVGTPSEVLNTMSQYALAGCDEFIVPCFNLGETSRALDTLSLFDAEVVRNLG